MGACEDFILTLKDGDMYMDKYGILSETTASELGIRSGDEFELIISARALAVVRTGECTPYSNVILHSGVVF